MATLFPDLNGQAVIFSDNQAGRLVTELQQANSRQYLLYVLNAGSDTRIGTIVEHATAGPNPQFTMVANRNDENDQDIDENVNTIEEAIDAIYNYDRENNA